MLQSLFERPIAFNRAYKTVTRSTVAALFLSQAVYWQNRSAGWFFKKSDEWEDETGLTRREQETARKVLKRLGVLKEKKEGVPCKLYYRIDFERLIQLLQTAANPVCQDSVSTPANFATSALSFDNPVCTDTPNKNGRLSVSTLRNSAKKRISKAKSNNPVCTDAPNKNGVIGNGLSSETGVVNPVCQELPSDLEIFAKNGNSVAKIDKLVCTDTPNKNGVIGNSVCTDAPNKNGGLGKQGYQNSKPNLENFSKNGNLDANLDNPVCADTPNKSGELGNPVCTNPPNCENLQNCEEKVHVYPGSTRVPQDIINKSTRVHQGTRINQGTRVPHQGVLLLKNSSNFLAARETDGLEVRLSEKEVQPMPSYPSDKTCNETGGGETSTPYTEILTIETCNETGGAENAHKSFIEGELSVDRENVQPSKKSRSNATETALKQKSKRKEKVESDIERAFRCGYYDFAKRATDWLVAHGCVQEDPARYWAWAKKLNRTDERVTVEVLKHCFNFYLQQRNGTGWRGSTKSFKQFVAAFHEIFQTLHNNLNTNTHAHQTILTDAKLKQEFNRSEEWRNAVLAIAREQRATS